MIVMFKKQQLASKSQKGKLENPCSFIKHYEPAAILMTIICVFLFELLTLMV